MGSQDSNVNSDGTPVDHDGASLEFGLDEIGIPFQVAGGVFQELLSGKKEQNHLESHSDGIQGPSMPSSSGGIPVEKSFETSSEEEEFIHEDDRTRIERESVNRAARATFATNREDRNELIALRLKYQEMQRMLEKRGISLVDLEKEALNERVEFNAGLNDASKFISGRDEFGLPVFTNKQGLAPKVDADPCQRE
ncbi:hypothetical protein POM88_021972 [Heracleum sosnowskyi]|uniref:Uncharacterized protein n=1 Tax=Heracleum sosnowskyi TaxID=360622 RepID=A0AAD8IGY1_9APIA|nr:hypothetical protein POM88_021972 [Heracleum sosnowskyi]